MSSRPLPSSFDRDSNFTEESRLSKFTRRLKEEPLIPIGCLITVYALYQSSRAIRAGDKARTNRMFRARIYGQAFTVAAMCAGSFYWARDREERKDTEFKIAEAKAREKQAAWICELEERDREERELQERAKRYATLREAAASREAKAKVEKGN
ncbi:hypoxia induced protein conserved region-domain-containing protein [Tuber brumale]|nr:hypoxia induced protein conserved region-domain-containing protein [Tuber brumale]